MYTVNYLDNYLRKFNCAQGLIEIGKLSKQLHQSRKSFDNFPIIVNGIKYQQTISQWGLSFFAYRLILLSNDGKSRRLTFSDIAQAHGIFGELNVPLDTIEDIISFLLRTSQEQFFSQQFHLPTTWARYLEIYQYEDFFSDAFYKLSQLTIEDYFKLGLIFSFYLSQMKEPTINIAQLTKAKYTLRTDDILISEKIERFLSLTAGTYEDIRYEARSRNNLILPYYEQFEFNPLMRYPIVRGDKRFSYYELIIPNPLLLDNKIAQGIYWELRSYYEKMNDKSKRNDFLKKFGEAFENYVHQLLLRYFGEENVSRAKDLIKVKNENRQADFIVTENDNIFIFECKSSLVPLIARQTFLATTISSWIRRNLVHAVTQLDTTENELIRSGFIGSKNVYKFILLHEELYIINTEFVKEQLLKNHLNARPTVNDIHIISINELEGMEQVIKNYGLSKIIEINSDTQRELAGNFISACRAIDNQVPIRNHYLESQFQKVVSDWAGKV